MFRVSLIPEGGFSIAMLGAEARFDALTEDRKAELRKDWFFEKVNKYYWFCSSIVSSESPMVFASYHSFW